jgi:hypothetical protein
MASGSAPSGGLEPLVVEALIERLREEGAPAGVWLIDITQARRALAGVDDLLYRLEQSLLRRHEAPDESPGS